MAVSLRDYARFGLFVLGGGAGQASRQCKIPRRCDALGNPGEGERVYGMIPNSVPGESEQDSGMKVNIGSGMKPNSFRPILNRVRLRRISLHRANGAGQHNGE